MIVAIYGLMYRSGLHREQLWVDCPEMDSILPHKVTDDFHQGMERGHWDSAAVESVF